MNFPQAKSISNNILQEQNTEQRSVSKTESDIGINLHIDTPD